MLLFAQAQALDQCQVAVVGRSLEVIEHLASLADHSQNATPGVIVLGVALEIAGQVTDTVGQ